MCPLRERSAGKWGNRRKRGNNLKTYGVYEKGTLGERSGFFQSVFHDSFYCSDPGIGVR